MQQHNNIRVIISGGGTGGHIFPAIAIANAVKKILPDTEFLFVGAEGKMEMEKVPAAGYKIEGLPITGIKREFTIGNLSFPLKLITSLSKATKIIKQFKPDVAVGVGGYASGPLLFVATRKNIPALIQEQNSFPGITNKLLAKRVQKICVAYDNMERFFQKEKIIKTGNPVREDILQTEGKKSEAAKYFGLDESKITLLVIGGSQGARSINMSLLAGLKQLSESGIQVIWQTGKPLFEKVKEEVAALNSPLFGRAVGGEATSQIKVHDFISSMDLAYAMCDLVVTRAGASTVSELCIVAKPAIMVPLPTAAEDHQTKNCLALVEKNAAILIRDVDAMKQLISTALQLANDANKREELKKNIAPLALPDSAKIIAEQVIALAKGNK